jgi:DNA mismatch endonuclease (patch repair protein)
VFPRARLAVFVDGDFWHGREWVRLQELLERRANPDYWIPKIRRNMERDAEQTGRLEGMGWSVLRLWETDVLKDVKVAADEVLLALQARRTTLDSAACSPFDAAAPSELP